MGLLSRSLIQVVLLRSFFRVLFSCGALRCHPDSTMWRVPTGVRRTHADFIQRRLFHVFCSEVFFLEVSLPRSFLLMVYSFGV
jgi:hypothetical protein